MAVTSSDGLSEIQLDEVTAQRSSDFEVWTDLISNVEQMYHDDINKIGLVYDSFLSEFPLCYGYWKKYAEHKARLCGVENAVQIFEQAVELAPYSVDVWLEYCNFGVSSFEDPSDVCRLFDKGLLFVGKDYLCYKIWDKYIEFEFSQQHWNSLANIYIRTLKFPTKKLHQYYESFRKLVAIWEEEMRCQGISCTKVLSEYEINDDIKTLEDTEISHVINDLLDSSTRSKALSKYRSIGEQFYQRACNLDGKVQKFERNIRRPYFHVKPLDDNQLQNWHQYLDLVEAEGDFDWAMKLYERCLISCANYPEFWMRYVDYVESKGAREIATDALERATLIFLKNGPQIHLFNAWFKEELGDVDGLRAAFEHCDQHYESYPIEYVRRKANMERRLGNYIAACNIYKEALDMATEKRPDTLPMLYLHFARLQLMITNNVNAAREVLLNGIQCVPRSKVLLKELILFAFMHEGAIQVDTLDSIMTKALTPGSDISSSLNAKECEDISSLYLELIDFCGSIHDVRRAWNRHLKLFPHVMRVDYSLKKPSKAYTVWKMINDGKPDHFDCCDQHSLGKHAENHLKEKVLDGQNIDQSEQDIDGQAQVGGSNNCSLNNMEMVASEATKTHPRDACGENESSDQAAADNSLLKVDSKTDGFHKEQDQQKELKNQLKPPSSDNPSLNPQDDESQNIAASPAPGFEPPPEASLSNRSTPASGRDIDDVPRIFGPVSPRDTNATGRDNGSPGPSFRQSHKNHSLEASPHRNSDREGNWGRLNPSGKGRPNVSSRNSEERRERSLSPRRRSHGYLDDRRHRERSLSPRRHRERSLSPRRHRERSLSPRRHNNSRWQRERRNHRNFRYHDNSRGRRDGRIQNENQAVVVGNTGQTPNFQPQSMGFVSQLQHNAQPVAYSQGQMKQGPVPSNENVGNLQNNQLYNQMWQYYYYNQQQQQLLQQQPPYQQQQMQPHQQLQQQMQNPSQQHMQASQQQPQPINAQQQQLLNLQYQQHLLSQQPQIQQQQQQQQQPPPTTEQPHSQEQQLQLQQQMQLPQQQLYQQLQQQQVQIQQQPQDEVDAQKQQQQAYQYQQLQQQQYLLYLQQLQQYQYSQQQPGLGKDQPSVQQQQNLPAKQEGQENLRELPLGDVKLQPEPQHGDGSLLVDPRSSSHCQQGPEVEGSHTSISSGVASLPPPQDQLPELEETDM